MTLTSSADRAATVARLRRLAVDGHVSNQHVRDTATRLDVTPRTIRRWLATDPDAAQDTRRVIVDIESTTTPANGNPDTPGRARFEITTEHLLAYADSRSAREAYRHLTRHGQIDCSFATFARALARVDPARRYGALEGVPRHGPATGCTCAPRPRTATTPSTSTTPTRTCASCPTTAPAPSSAPT